MTRSRFLLASLTTILISAVPFLPAHQAIGQGTPMTRVDSIQALPSGIEIHSGPGILRVRALRNDVLQFTMSATSQLPLSGSWAVLDSARQARAQVSPFSDSSAVGFDTSTLKLRVARNSMQITVTDADGHVLMQDASPVHFYKSDEQGDTGFVVWKKMPSDEHYFGLGDKAAPLDHRGWQFTMWNRDHPRWFRGTDPLYKDIPYFMAFRAGAAYGLLLDNTWRSTFDFGKERRDEFSFGAEGGPLRYYFFFGPAPKQVEEDYAWLTGAAPLPPKWSLGYQQSRWSYGTETEVRSIADRLRNDRIPADVLYMDIDYQVHNRPFTVDAAKFPNFPAFVQELAKKHFHLIMITDLHIAYLPNQNYMPFNSGEQGDHFLHNPDGSLFVGDVWPGPAVFPDFTQQSTRKWWGSLYKQFYSYGVGGFWNDMNEPSVFNTPDKTMPLDAVGQIEGPGFETRTVTQREIHNIMGIENSRATFDGLLALNPNQRPFVLTRSSFAGGQRYAATWTGDNSSSWDHLRLSTPMLESLGLGGFYMVGDDIGGFSGSPQMDLLTKWIELGTFNPIDRDHTDKPSKPQEPWVGGPQQEAIRRNYIGTRYRLLPYFYTTVDEASRTGIPIMRPLFLEFPDATADKHPLDDDVPNEFLFGPDLLVAPPNYPDETDNYDVTFPPGPWFDFWSGKEVAHPNTAAAQPATLQTTSITPTLAVLPVYARGGSVIPMQPLVQSTGQTPNGPLELRVYPGPNCHGSIYDDDGVTLNYKKEGYLRVAYTCESGPNRLTLHIGAQQGSYPAWWKQIQVSVFGWHAAAVQAQLDGKPIEGAKYNPQQASLDMVIPQNSEGETLTIASQ
ncbi:MAG TPA: TIM-barrel domain-containing protein [Terracidiphilus sp.]|nr:TIM-barrel domain-containing protein [Terracidiphilus sp.]